MNDGSFSSTISAKDRERLRQIVRQTHLKFYPQEYLTTLEVDKFIDAMGAEVVVKMLRQAVNSGMVN